MNINTVIKNTKLKYSSLYYYKAARILCSLHMQYIVNEACWSYPSALSETASMAQFSVDQNIVTGYITTINSVRSWE